MLRPIGTSLILFGTSATFSAAEARTLLRLDRDDRNISGRAISRRRRAMSVKCGVPSCEVMIFGQAKICDHHWHRVPKVLQDALKRATPGDQYSAALADCVQAAIQPPGTIVGPWIHKHPS
jgi:hypothetical protein